MKSNIFQIVLLLALIYSPSVLGVGQLFLNTVNPVKSDTVTFENDVFTYDGVVESLNTQTFQILKQYELNVQVPQIALNTEEALTINGALGTGINSVNGDVAVGGNTASVSGHSISLNALQSFSVSSTNEDITFTSQLSTSILAAGANITTTSTNGINIVSAGDVDFNTNDELNVVASEFTASNQGDFTLDSERGGVQFASGSSFDLTANGQIEVNGILGVNYVTSGDLLVNADQSFVFAQAISNLAISDIAFTFSNTTVASEEDIKVWGDSVRVASGLSNIAIKAVYQYSDITLSADSDVILNSMNLVSLVSEGESGDVLIASNAFNLTAYSLTSTIGGDWKLGTQQTNNINLYSTASTFTLSAYYLDISASELVSINTTSLTYFNALGDIQFESNAGEVNADSTLSFTSDDFYLYSDIGDGSVALTATQSGISVSAQGDASFSTFSLSGAFSGSQSYTINDNLLIQSYDDDVNVGASSSISITSSNFEITSFNAKWNATDLMTFDLNTIQFTSDNLDMLSNSTISFTALSSLYFGCGNTLNLESADFTLTASSSFSVVVGASVTMETGNTLFNSGSVIIIQLSESFIADVTDLFSVSSNLFSLGSTNSYWESSNIVLSASQNITVDSQLFTGKFGALTVDVTNKALFDTQGAGNIQFISGENLSVSSLSLIDFSVSGTITFAAEETLTLSGNDTQILAQSISFSSNTGDQVVSGVDMNSKITGDTGFFGSDVSALADGAYTLQSKAGLSISGGDVSFSSGSNNQELSLTSVDSMSFATPTSPFTYEIVANERVLKINTDDTFTTTSSGSVSYSSASLDFSSVNASMSASGSLTLQGSSATVNGDSSATVTSTDRSSFISGDDDYIKVSAKTNMTFTNTDSSFKIVGEGDVKFDAANDLSIEVGNAFSFTDRFVVKVAADNDLTVTATTNDLQIQSASSVNINNENQFDVLVRSYQDSINTFFSDFGIEANGIDNATECGVLLSAFMDGGSSQSYTSTDTLSILGDKCVEVRSFYSGAGIPSGDISLTSSGHVFYKSDTQGVTFLSNGVDDAYSVAAVYLKSNYGTVEVQSTRANITALANQGATFTSQNDFNVFGLRGVHMKSDGEAANINIRAGADSILEGARGLTLAAGTDAPSYAGDLTTSAGELLYIETFNNILIRSFSYVSDPNAILFNSQTNTEVTSNDGSGINFSAAGDMYMNAQSTISFSGSNGLVRFDADVDDMTMTAADLSWSTTRGPIGIEGRGSGSSVTFTTTNFTSSSYESSRFRALGSALITADTDLSLTSTDSTQCVLIQTERAYDSIYLNANEDFTLTINTNSPVYDQEHIIVSGNNIDIDAGNAVDFIQDSLFEIGRDSTPVVRVVAGGANAVGVSTTSVGSIEFISGGTFASSSVGDTTFDTTNFNVSSSGVITFDSQGTAISIVNDELFTVTADEILEIAPSGYTVTANEAITIQSNGDTPGDRIEFDSLTFVTFLGTGADTTFQYQFDLVTLTALDINISTDNETVIANTGRYYWSYDLYSNPFDQLETELGLVNFISSNDLSITAVNASLSAVEEDLNVITNSDMIVTSPTIVSVNSNNELIFSGSLFNVSVATITLNACDGCVTAFNGQSDLLPLYDSPLNQPSNQGDILFDAYTSITIDNQASTFQVSATEDIIFSSFDATSVTVGNDWSVSVSDATESNLISFISQNDFSLQITANFDWTTDPAYYFVHQNNGKEFNASNSLSITTPLLTASSTNQNVNFIADQIVLGLNTAATALSFTYNSIYIQSEEQESPISWNVGSTLDVQYTALAEFVATDRMSIIAGGAITITDQQSYYRSYSGDVLFSTATINLTPTATATVTASGYSSVNDAGIQVNGDSVALTGPTTLIQGYKSNDFRTYGDTSSITFPTLQTLNLATTNFGSDIVFDSLGVLLWNADAFTATNDATVLSSANSLTVTVTGDLTLVSDLGRVEFTTKLIDQPSLLSLSSNTETTVTASEYLKISTVPVSSFNSQITLKSTGTGSIMNIASNVANAAGSSFEVTSEAGGIVFSSQPTFTTPTTLTIDAGEVSLGSLTATLTGTGALYDIQVDGDVLSNQYSFDSSGTTLFQTNGARIENDISFVAGSISFTGVGMDIYTEGYSSDVLLYSPAGQSSLSAEGSLNLEVSEGIRFLLTNNVGGDTFTVSAGGVMTITAYDWEDSIFFQSDTQIVITSNEIRQATYNHRLGFFAQIPDFIHLVNLQSQEACVRYGYCGYTNDNGNGNASYSDRLANLDAITSDLQNALMALGLIEYHNSLI